MQARDADTFLDLFDELLEVPAIETSGRELTPAGPRAEVVLHDGGSGSGLNDAMALVDAGTPSGVPGPGVDILARALFAAIRAVATGDETPLDLSHTALENVTIVFTDLVGWTTLATRLGPDAADDLRHRHFSAMHRAITETGGALVKNLGDGVMAVFTRASAALACAVAMQRAVDQDNCNSGRSLGLRVGISGGEVVREGADYFGDPVVEAARLCGMTSAGTIVVAQVVKEMAGRRSRFRYLDVGPVELKGLPESVPAYEVDWEPGPPF